jgi:hypothetical protein
VTAAEVAQVILASATLLSALAGVVVALRTGSKVDATHTLVNGQSGVLNALTGKAAYAEGVLAGSAEPRKPLSEQQADNDSVDQHPPS